jgi:hypothetical protein
MKSFFCNYLHPFPIVSPHGASVCLMDKAYGWGMGQKCGATLSDHLVLSPYFLRMPPPWDFALQKAYLILNFISRTPHLKVYITFNNII